MRAIHGHGRPLAVGDFVTLADGRLAVVVSLTACEEAAYTVMQGALVLVDEPPVPAETSPTPVEGLQDE